MRRATDAAFKQASAPPLWGHHTMKPIKREDVRQVLIHFAELAAPARLEFLGAMNEYLFASPQRRRVIVQAWKEQDQTRGDGVPPASHDNA